jgi:hypothetical protein
MPQYLHKQNLHIVLLCDGWLRPQICTEEKFKVQTYAMDWQGAYMMNASQEQI